jgi:hypothetical protein
MSARVVHAFLITLILANPVCCRMVAYGWVVPSACSGGYCGSCGSEQGTPCQGRNPGGTDRERPRPTRPCDSPDESFCQCFPAGAIVPEATSPDTARDAHAPDRIDVMPTAPRPEADFSSAGLHGRWPPGKANPGRFVRCLHASFLC